MTLSPLVLSPASAPAAPAASGPAAVPARAVRLLGAALVLGAALAAPARGQDVVEIAVPGASAPLPLLVGGSPVAGMAPTLLQVAPGPGLEQRAALAVLDPEAAAAAGWRLLVAPRTIVDDAAARDALLRHVHTEIAVAGGRLHLAGPVDDALRLALARPFAFDRVRAQGSPTVLPPPVGDLARLRFQTLVPDEGAAALAEQARTAAVGPAVAPAGREVVAWRAVASTLPDVPAAERAVAAALDEFFDAAAKGDGPRYFGSFTADGVFLGTDPDERWTLEAFREFGRPYFNGDSAWIFVPQRRHLQVDADAGYASFHEVLGSTSYGECRGTGTMRRVDGVWRVVLYDLTVPVPNALMREVVAGIRLRDRAVALGFAAEAEPGTSRVFVLRHAEKVDAGRDPELSASGQARATRLARLLAEVAVTTIVATEFRRTQATVTPLARALGREVTVRPARAVQDLVRDLRSVWRGQQVVVCGHSNTVPAILAGLGVEAPADFGEGSYGDLFVVETPPVGSPQLLHLRLDGP